MPRNTSWRRESRSPTLAYRNTSINPLFLLGHGVEDPADGVHGDKEYLYVVEIPTTN